MLNYSNTDCLGSPLTNKSPVAFNALVRNNNCATLNGTTDYIYLGDDNVLSGVSKVSCRCKLSSSTTAQYIFSNIFSKTTYGNALAVLESTNPKVRLTIENKHYYSVEAYTILTDNNFHTIEVSNVGTLKIDNISYELTQDDNENIFSYTFIGTRSINNSLGNYYSGSICDFKCYSGNTLLHWYPTAEGAGSIVYDAVGTVNGTITSTSLTTFWETKQDVFAYNLTEGFKYPTPDSRTSLLTNELPYNISRIPLGSDYIIYKSNYGKSIAEYESATVNNGSTGVAYLNFSIVDGKILNIVSNTNIQYEVNNVIRFTIRNVYSFINRDINSVTFGGYKLDMRISNSSTANITDIQLGMGASNSRLPMSNIQIYDVNGVLQSSTTIPNDGQYYRVIADIPNTWTHSRTLATLMLVGFKLDSNVATSTININIARLIVTQTTNFEEHPKLDYGHNLAESTLNFTQGISNIAELNVLSGIDNYTPATDIGGLYKRTITAGEKNYLLYKQPQTNTNLQRINNKETFYD